MSRRQVTASELLAQAEANGYSRGIHTERDQVKDANKHNKKTKINHEATLHHYVLWQLAEIERGCVRHGQSGPTEEEVRAKCLQPGVVARVLATIKDFLRFYIATSCPRLSDKPTVDSMGSIAEWFFAALTRVMGTVIPAGDRSEVYNWIRRVLTNEGLAVNKRKPKHNFSCRDLDRHQSTPWTKDDLVFIPERYRIQFTYILRVFCWTGAQIDAFFTHGLRYRDIQLVLQRTPYAPWEMIYRLTSDG